MSCILAASKLSRSVLLFFTSFVYFVDNAFKNLSTKYAKAENRKQN